MFGNGRPCLESTGEQFASVLIGFGLLECYRVNLLETSLL